MKLIDYLNKQTATIDSVIYGRKHVYKFYPSFNFNASQQVVLCVTDTFFDPISAFLTPIKAKYDENDGKYYVDIPTIESICGDTIQPSKENIATGSRLHTKSHQYLVAWDKEQLLVREDGLVIHMAGGRVNYNSLVGRFTKDVVDRMTIDLYRSG